MVFLWKMREKGKGVGRWGGDRQRNRQVIAHAFVKTTLWQSTLLSLEICALAMPPGKGGCRRF